MKKNLIDYYAGSTFEAHSISSHISKSVLSFSNGFNVVIFRGNKKHGIFVGRKRGSGWETYYTLTRLNPFLTPMKINSIASFVESCKGTVPVFYMKWVIDRLYRGRVEHGEGIH